MVHSLEVGIPCVDWIRLVGHNRWIPIEQIEECVCRTGDRGDLYPRDQVAGCAIVFFHFPLEFCSAPGVGIKTDVEPVGIGYVATVGNRLKCRISEAY